jgi:hypothetical protein
MCKYCIQRIFFCNLRLERIFMPTRRGKKSRRNGSKGSNKSSRDGSGSEIDFEAPVEVAGNVDAVPQPESIPLPEETPAAVVVELEASPVVDSPGDPLTAPPESVPIGEETVDRVSADMQESVISAELVEGVDTPQAEAVEVKGSESPEREDQVLDAAAASPFLTPSGLRIKTAGDVNVQQSEFNLSPGTEGEENQGTDRRAEIPGDDLLRQSVDLAQLNLETTTPRYPQISSVRSSPRSVAGPVATSTDGQVTVMVEGEPFEQAGMSPRTDRSGSIPVSATSPLPYPQSPASQLPPIPTPKVSSVISGTPKSVYLPALSTPAGPVAVGTPTKLMVSIATPLSSTIFASTEMVSSPVKSVAFEPVPGTTQFQAAPRTQGLDSVALQADTILFESLATTATAGPISIMTNSTTPTRAFQPISFEEAMVSLTGSSGKSWRMVNTCIPPKETSSTSFLSAFCSCFGSSKSALLPVLEHDKNTQNMLMSTRFDPAVLTHRRLLQTIYVYFTGDERDNLPMVGPHWKSIGFASLDPSTELGSVLNLVCILTLIEDYGIDAQRIFKSSLQQGWAFSAKCAALAGAASRAASRGALNRSYNDARQVVPVTCLLFVGLLKRLASSEYKPEDFDTVIRTLTRQCETQNGAIVTLEAAARKI